MTTVFQMPDEWLYIDDPDLHQRLMNEKKIEVSFKMNEQSQIAFKEQEPRRVEFEFACGEKTLLKTAYMIDPVAKSITREA